jgi:hypothetical protein
MHNASMVRYVDFAIGHGMNHSIIAKTAKHRSRRKNQQQFI